MKEEVRVFALDRVKMTGISGDRFESLDDFSLDDFLRPSFGVFQGEPVKVKIWSPHDVSFYQWF